MSEPPGPRQRPLLTADLTALASAALDGDPAARLEFAHATADALVRAGREGDAGGIGHLVRLVDTIGLETLGELWRGSPPDSLPGAMWTLYLLRTWCLRQGESVARLYQAGRPLAPVDEVVAGVADGAGPEEMAVTADAVLTGAYRGDFAVALERAAAFFRVVSAGRHQVAGDGPAGAADRELADRNNRCADALGRAAAAWRRGGLR